MRYTSRVLTNPNVSAVVTETNRPSVLSHTKGKRACNASQVWRSTRRSLGILSAREIGRAVRMVFTY